jgi:hypothetical protein
MDVTALFKNVVDTIAKLEVATAEAVTKEFTSASFSDYVCDQLSQAQADDDADIRKSRLAHLAENVKYIQKQGGWDSSATATLPVFSGPNSVQAQTAWRERSERDQHTASAAAANMSQGWIMKGDGEEAEEPEAEVSEVQKADPLGYIDLNCSEFLADEESW